MTNDALQTDAVTGNALRAPLHGNSSSALLRAIQTPAEGVEGASQDASTAAFHAFLRAKQSVDDRALHKGVYAALCEWLAQPHAQPNGSPLEVLEVGCGIGTMVRRLEHWGAWDECRVPVRYTALDRDPANIALLAPFAASSQSDKFALVPIANDFYSFATEAIVRGRRFDLIIAHAVLDLLHLPRALPLLRQLITPNGAGWFTLNFDGATILEPPIDPPFDDLIEARYHATMDARVTDGAPSGDSRTGRHLFSALPGAGFAIVAAGASDWVVAPQSGTYPGEERQFVHSILETMRGALAGDVQVDAQRFASWIAQRHSQLANGNLTYLAKQYDFLVRAQ